MEKNNQYVTFKQLEQNLIEQIAFSVFNSDGNGENSSGFSSGENYYESDSSCYSSSDAELNQITDQLCAATFK